PAARTPGLHSFWRADVVALFGSNGHMLHQVRYDPYGVPFGISKADINGDGVLDSADSSLFVTLYNSGSGTHPFADWNLDGTLSSLDLIAYGNSYSADAGLGYGVLSYDFARAGGANRKGYAGYELAPELSSAKPCLYHVRYRVYDASLGRWTRRDPLGYVDGMSMYAFVGGRPIASTDPFGLATTPGGGDGAGCGASQECASGGTPTVYPPIDGTRRDSWWPIPYPTREADYPTIADCITDTLLRTSQGISNGACPGRLAVDVAACCNTYVPPASSKVAAFQKCKEKARNRAQRCNRRDPLPPPPLGIPKRPPCGAPCYRMTSLTA
ncbi:MAG: hypothetical protein KJZ54_16360, partial [Phycisphaerales bacterium]|nr:hypothetical protein [Phycisphaerales bacterium]